MADNVAITAGSGTNIATDDVAGVHYQRVKLVNGTLDATDAIGGDATNGLDVDVTRVQGSVTVIQGTQANLKAEVYQGSTFTVSVSGTVDTELPTAAALADNAANPTVPGVGAFAMVFDGATWDRAPGTSADGLLVNLGTNNDVTVSGTVTANAGTGTFTVANGGTFAVQVDNSPVLGAGSNNIGDVDVLTVPAPLNVTGTGTEASALRVTIATDSTGVLSIDDNAGSLTVDNGGTFAVQASQAGTWTLGANSGVDVGDVTINNAGGGSAVNIQDGGNAITVDNGGTFAVQAAQSGTWTVQPGNTANTTPWLVSQTPATSGGLSTWHLVSAASTNATVIKGSAGQVYGWYLYNSNASSRKVAFHNTASTPTAGASVFFSLVLPPNSGANVAFPSGIAFSTGIAVTMVTGNADTDATAVASGDIIANIFYK